jgi:hypothetical protein
MLRIRIRDPVSFWPLDPGSGMEKIRIRDKHTRSATLPCCPNHQCELREDYTIGGFQYRRAHRTIKKGRKPRFFAVVLFWPTLRRGSAWLWCGSGSGFSLRCGYGSDFSLWYGSGSGSGFCNADPDPHQSDENLQYWPTHPPRLQCKPPRLYCESCMAPGYRMPLRFHCEPPQLRLLNLIWLLTLMWIRIRRRPLKMMPIHADPDPQHWVHPWAPASESWQHLSAFRKSKRERRVETLSLYQLKWGTQIRR